MYKVMCILELYSVETCGEKLMIDISVRCYAWYGGIVAWYAWYAKSCEICVSLINVNGTLAAVLTVVERPSSSL